MFPADTTIMVIMVLIPTIITIITILTSMLTVPQAITMAMMQTIIPIWHGGTGATKK